MPHTRYLNLAARYGHDYARQLLKSIHLQATPSLMRNCTKVGATVTCTTGSN